VGELRVERLCSFEKKGKYNRKSKDSVPFFSGSENQVKSLVLTNVIHHGKAVGN
jgi:hypothetical protein